MAILQIYIPKRLDSGRVARNLAGAVEFLAIGSSVQQAKSMLYKGGLKPVNLEPLTNEELLSFGHTGVFGLPARNAIYFESISGVIFNLMDVTIDVTLQNTIVKTALTGMKGTVKEYICAEDYQVDISGSLLSYRQNAFPINDLRDFVSVLEEEGPLRVASVFLEFWSINKLVLQSYKIPQSDAKFANQQKFLLRFLSDTDVNLEIN